MTRWKFDSQQTFLNTEYSEEYTKTSTLVHPITITLDDCVLRLHRESLSFFTTPAQNRVPLILLFLLLLLLVVLLIIISHSHSRLNPHSHTHSHSTPQFQTLKRHFSLLPPPVPLRP
jgi:hypothetical protein